MPSLCYLKQVPCQAWTLFLQLINGDGMNGGCPPIAGLEAIVTSEALGRTERPLGSPNHSSNAGEATENTVQGSETRDALEKSGFT